jgi:hypothetical protein
VGSSVSTRFRSLPLSVEADAVGGIACSLLNSDTVVTAGLDSSADHICVGGIVGVVGELAELVLGFSQFLRFSDAHEPHELRYAPAREEAAWTDA